MLFTVGGIVTMQCVNLPLDIWEIIQLESGRIALLFIIVLGLIIMIKAVFSKSRYYRGTLIPVILYCLAVISFSSLHYFLPFLVQFLSTVEVTGFLIGACLACLIWLRYDVRSNKHRCKTGHKFRCVFL